MFSTPISSLRRRIGLAVGAGTLVLLGGAGIAYAATSSTEPVETGWATVDAGDDSGSGAAGSATDWGEQTRSGDDCPDQGVGGTAPGQEPQSSSPDGGL